MNNFVEQIFYHYILNDNELALKVKGDFFKAKNLQLLFNIAQDHVSKYKCAPSLEQIKELIKIDGKAEILTDDIVNIIYSSKNKLGEYSEQWLETSVTNWAKWQNFTTSVRNLVAYIKSVEVNEDNVAEIMERAKSSFTNSAILQLDESPGADFFDALCHKQDELQRTPTNYKYIDTCLGGGSWKGSLIVFVADPKAGKSLWLQNLCAKSVINGDDCAYISLELPEPMIINRIGSNLLGIPSLDYERYANDTEFIKTKIQSFVNSGIKPRGSLWIKAFPPSTLTANELENAIRKEEERRSLPGKPFKFKKIYLDYLNIMKNWRNPNSENTYMKIKQLAEDVKAISVANDWAMFTATQTSRGAWGASDMQVTDVAESAGLNATVDAMFGIIADQMMKAQGIYKLKCLLDRVVPMDNTYMMYRNDKNYLRIEEDATDTWHECDYVFKDVTKSYKTNTQDHPQQNASAGSGATAPTLNIDQNLMKISGTDLF